MDHHAAPPRAHRRDYPAAMRALPAAPASAREARMTAAIEALWPILSTAGVSWAGFYTITHDGPPTARGDEMLLGPRRDKPACSPIGMHGACGRSFLSRRPLIVTDVAHLGQGYIACDPRDRSEVVLPLFNDDQSCWGVLDIDSHDTHAFDESDVAALQHLLECAGLTTPRDWKDRTETV